MNVDLMLARARDLHQQVMVDACTITRDTRGSLNESTGAYGVTTATVYSGPCRVKPVAAAVVDAAGIAVWTARPTLDLPWTAAGVVEPGDQVTVAGGLLAHVVAETVGTTSTCRRYEVEEVRT